MLIPPNHRARGEEMMRFKTRPCFVEAVRFNPSREHKMKLPEGVFVTKHSVNADNYNYMGFEFAVTTIHGHQTPVVPGDWIVQEPDGIHYYPVKNEVFDMRYEPAWPLHPGRKEMRGR